MEPAPTTAKIASRRPFDSAQGAPWGKDITGLGLTFKESLPMLIHKADGWIVCEALSGKSVWSFKVKHFSKHTFFVFLLLLLTLLIVSAQAAEPLLLYGYWHVQTTFFGFLMEDVADFTNVLMMDPARFTRWDDIFDPEIGIPRALELGYNVILDIGPILHTYLPSPEIFEQEAGLFSLKMRESGYLNPQNLFAVFVIDEPPNVGLTYEDQVLALEVVERYFPGVPKIINYSIGQVLTPNLLIPEAVDIVGYDAYYFTTQNADMSPQALEAYLEAGMASIRRKAPGKPVILIGQSYQRARSGVFMPTNEQLDWYVDYAIRTPEIIGYFWFMLGSGRPGGPGDGIQGAISFPEQLEHQRTIGKRLLPDLFRSRAVPITDQ